MARVNLLYTQVFRFIIFLFLFTGQVDAQSIKSFTPEAKKFIEELRTFFKETASEQSAEALEEFIPYWQKGRLSTSQQDAIYRTANQMLKKRMKAEPDFRNYLATLVEYINSSQPESVFNAWQQSLDALLQGKNTVFAPFILVSKSLFADNALYSSQYVTWRADNNNYSFSFDSLPKITFPSMTLTCVAKGDSSVVYNTKGVYYPTAETFYGNGGRVNWRRAGWDVDKIYATLKNYSLDVSKAEFTADSVTFYNPHYFKQPLTGRYYDKILASVTPEDATYPRFQSYDISLEIKNLFADIDYRGGFALQGSRMMGTGNKEEPASIYFHPKNKLQMVTSSQGFIMRTDRITSQRASVTIYFENDSIYHPGLEMKYIDKDREVALILGESQSNTPYFDTYHQVFMYFDAMYWKVDDPIMNLKMITGKETSRLVFESADFYRESRFNRIQATSDISPLATIKRFAEKNQSKIVYPDELAKYMRLPVSDVRILLINLAAQGFVSYDGVEDKALIKDRLYFYLLARSGKTDYDVLAFESVISAKSNASINLLNFDINMRGVSRIAVSDSQNVFIYPKEQEITLKKNRDFTFAGRVRAGRFDFYGNNFAFDYHNFKINLDHIDSLRMRVPDETGQPDIYGNFPLTPIKTVLENITGDLQVDYLGNKSGLKNYPEYPVFNSKKDCYAYYDKPWIQSGAYLKETFYFHLDPFSVDSLDNFNKDGLRFGGELVSAGIFPDFKDTLRLQPDYSLGLTRFTAENGMQAYGGKGTFYNKINLSHDGLIGSGKLEYLASTSRSDRFIFLPDSTNADAMDFVLKKGPYNGAEFPSVSANEIYIHWLPKQDQMFVNRKKDPMIMYDALAKLEGNLLLEPKGLSGNGLMSFEKAEMESNLYAFKEKSFRADTADLRLLSDRVGEFAFASKNVNSMIDFEKRLGEFRSNGVGSYVTFPANQYICYIDQFRWFMDKKEIEIGAPLVAEATGTGSEFISVHPAQDSLRWVAQKAAYNLNDFIIKADGVKEIKVADASIVPDSGKVVVEKEAHMRTLVNAGIVADTLHKYHSIFNATVNIGGRKKYAGTGEYYFVDQSKEKHLVKFSSVGVDATGQTIADGTVDEAANLMFSPRFKYKGGVALAASRKYLTFNGYTKPVFNCTQLTASWFDFKGEINPDSIRIPITAPVNDNGVRLYASILFASDSARVYSTFLTPKERQKDKEIISATGFLTFDNETNEFRISTEEKLKSPNSAGNYVSFDDRKCISYGEGKLDLAVDYGQMTLTQIGNVTHNLNNDSTDFDLMLGFDFFFAEEAMKMLADNILGTGILTPTQDLTRGTYLKGLPEIIGKEKAEKMINEMSLYGTVKKVPDELAKTIFFTDLKMRWNPKSSSYRSVGEIGIGYIGKEQIHRKMKGNVELVRRRSSDVLNIYLQVDNFTWYYFSYQRGLLQVISSNSAFNDFINNLKPEKKIIKPKDDKPGLEFILSNDRRKNEFLKRLNPEEEEDQE